MQFKPRSSVETLLERGFQPTRTFVLAFGFDEEISGREVRFVSKSFTFYYYTLFQGAGHLSKTLLSTYGEDAFAFIIDEGGMFNNSMRTSMNW